jgi:hypothetical protein
MNKGKKTDQMLFASSNLRIFMLTKEISPILIDEESEETRKGKNFFGQFRSRDFEGIFLFLFYRGV